MTGERVPDLGGDLVEGGRRDQPEADTGQGAAASRKLFVVSARNGATKAALTMPAPQPCDPAPVAPQWERE